VPIDRAATLRNAEKLIRQGKLEAAIAEYLRIVEDQPRDWNAANVLGDLYARAGQTEKAIEQFNQIAESLNEGGAVAKAGALYKKVLKLKPDHEHALLQVADVLASQGLYADARSHLNTVIELRRGRGDTRGVLQAKVRLGSIDPEDQEGRLTAARARIEMGDVGGAMRDLKEIAAELAEKARHPEAIEVLREARTLNADDEEIREKLLDVYFAAGDFVQARECATTMEQFRMIAAALQSQGNVDEAVDTLCRAASLDLGDAALKAQLARAFLARGDPATAAAYLDAEVAGDDPELLLTLADIQLRGDKWEDGLAIVRRLLDEDASRRENIALLGWTVAEQKPLAGFGVVELAANTAVAQNDWPGAAAVLQEFVTRVPNHIPALMRLVEICVDGGLEATMYSAQAQLADAYIAAGAASEARFIAEDLVAREPWEKSNIERFRRALELLGEPDPDALIAARLSGESPFTTTDLLHGGVLSLNEELFPASEPAPSADSLSVDDLIEAAAAADEPVNRPSRTQVRRKDEEHLFQLSANAVDLEGIFGELESPPATAHAASEDVEVDLSIVLDDIKPAPLPLPASQIQPDLDGVFGNLRDQASRRSGAEEGEKDYQRGLALRDAGDFEGCMQALEKASRAPGLRFAAASLLGRLFDERNLLPQALEWLERAAQAPAPTADEGHALLYDLADALERYGETSRALAICLEIQAEAGEYRDVAARIERLTKVQA